MTKLTKILLVILVALLVAFALIYFFVLNNRPSADVNTTVKPQSMYGISLTDPANNSVTRVVTNHILYAKYYGDISAQIKDADVAVNEVPAAGAEIPLARSPIEYKQYNAWIKVTVTANFKPGTIYHFTIKPSGTDSTDPVDIKFMTQSTSAPTTPTIKQNADSSFQSTQNTAAVCTFRIGQQGNVNTVLKTDLSYKNCTADMYIRRGASVNLDYEGSSGLKPSKKKQAFQLLTSLDTTAIGSQSGKLYIKIMATNSMGSKSSTNLAFSHIDPVIFSTITQAGPNNWSLTSEPIYTVDASGYATNLANTVIPVTVNIAGKTPAAPQNYTTDTNGVLTLPVTVSSTDTQFYDISANYTIGTVTMPIISNKFIMANY